MQRLVLTGSTNGKPIKVAATSTPGTTIHTTVTGTVEIDQVFLWVSNTSASAATLTIEWGGTTDPDHHLVKGYSVAANSGPVLIAQGLMMNNALVIKAFSGTANVLNITGYVQRHQR